MTLRGAFQVGMINIQLQPGFYPSSSYLLTTRAQCWRASFDQVSIAACWQGLEITVRIGYMHNAAHPQSLFPCRAKEAAFQVGRYRKVPPQTPPTLVSDALDHSPAAVPCFHPSARAIGKAQWVDLGLQATVQYMAATRNARWGRRAKERCGDVGMVCNPPAPPCPVSCLSPSVPLLVQVQALSCCALILESLLSFSVLLLTLSLSLVFDPKGTTLSSFGPPSFVSILWHHCMRASCASLTHRPAFFSDLSVQRAPRHCRVQVHARCSDFPASACQPHANSCTGALTDRASGKNLIEGSINPNEHMVLAFAALELRRLTHDHVVNIAWASGNHKYLTDRILPWRYIFSFRLCTLLASGTRFLDIYVTTNRHPSKHSAPVD